MSGQIVDASIVSAPKQRNDDGEKTAINEGRVPEGWEDKLAKLRRKDRDARWTMKRGRVQRLADGTSKGAEIMIAAFGYKTHISTDRRHGLIRKWTVRSQRRQTAQGVDRDPGNTASSVWADTAYRSRNNETWLEKQGKTSMIHFRKPSCHFSVKSRRH